MADISLRDLAERYDLLSEVGRGGMGVVYRARDRETGEVVALKILKPELANRLDVIERFKAELRLARKVTHKNVCRTHELLRFGETVVIAMEYVEGESLRAFLGKYGSVPLRRGLEWARQICDALAEAHAQSVCHRDLKPENVLIDRQCQVKVTDFGIARSFEADATATGTVLGTPAYMSPEQAQGKLSDQRGDLYSLGLILYEMFAGKRAFDAESPLALAVKQIKETPPPPRSVEPYLPSFLGGAIEKCLEKDPQKRFQSATELVAALGEKEMGEAKAAPIELPDHLLHARRSDLGLVLLGVVGLMGLIALAPRTSPEAGLRVRLTREMFFEKAREEVSRRGWKPPADSTLMTIRDADPYEFLAQRVGFRDAQQRLARDFPPFLVNIRFREPRAGPMMSMMMEGPGVVFEPGGSLRSVELPIRGWVPAVNGLPREESVRVAQKAIREAFEVDPTQLAVENEAPLATEGRHGLSFKWTRREPTGIEWHYQADVYDRLTVLKRWITLPEDYRPPRPSSFPIVLFTLWTVVAGVLFFARRVFTEVRRRDAIVLSVAGLVCGVGMGVAFPSGTDVGLSLFLTIFLAAFYASWAVVVSPTIVHVARRPWPSLTTTYSSLVQLRPLGQATGLGLVRGIASGLAILATYSLLLWVASSSRLTQPPLWRGYALQTASFAPLLTVLAMVLTESVGIGFSLGFLLSLIRRWTSSSLALVAAGGVVSVALSGFTLPPDWCQLTLTFLTGVALSALLACFDFVTLLGASVTINLWRAVYPSLLVFESVGNWPYWTLVIVWTGILAWSIFAAFRPTWSRLGRRLAETFE